MIIRLEADGQACLDDDNSDLEKKSSLDIPVPEQSYHPDQPVHPALRNINTGYASSIATTSDSQSITIAPHNLQQSSISTRRRLPLFPDSFSSARHEEQQDPIFNGPTVVDLPSNRAKRQSKSRPLSWSELSKSRKRLISWTLLTVGLCALVAIIVWSAVKASIKREFFRNPNEQWSPQDMNIYNAPVEMFGCANQTVVPANSSQVLLFLPYGSEATHHFAIDGGASGQVTLTSSPDPTAKEIAYDIVLEGPEPALRGVSFSTPSTTDAINPTTTFIITAPPMPFPPPPPPPGSSPSPFPCLRYDITVYIPKALKTLYLNISTPSQVTFSPQGHIELDDLSVILSHPHPRTRIETTESLHALRMDLSVFNGVIHGYLSIGDSASVSSLNGQIWLHAIPNSPTDLAHPATATLSTFTDSGQIALSYLRNNAYRRRNIESHHVFGVENHRTYGAMDYSRSGFAGLVFSNSSLYNVTNPTFQRFVATELTGADGWTRVWGNKTESDQIFLTSGKGHLILP